MDYIRVGWGVKIKPLQRNKQQEGSHLAFYSAGINLPSLRQVAFGRSLLMAGHFWQVTSEETSSQVQLPLIYLPWASFIPFDRHVLNTARSLLQAQGERE